MHASHTASVDDILGFPAASSATQAGTQLNFKLAPRHTATRRGVDYLLAGGGGDISAREWPGRQWPGPLRQPRRTNLEGGKARAPPRFLPPSTPRIRSPLRRRPGVTNRPTRRRGPNPSRSQVSAYLFRISLPPHHLDVTPLNGKGAAAGGGGLGGAVGKRRAKARRASGEIGRAHV